MTLKNKLLACLGLLALTTTLLIAGFYSSSSHSKAALETVLNDRVEPLRELKKVADGYAVAIVNSAHKARNGNIAFAEASSRIERGSADLHEAWKAYKATDIEGEEARLADTAEQRMRVSDEQVARLEQILRQGDHAALDRFVINDLYSAIDPVSETMNSLVDLQIKVASDVTNGALGRAHTMLVLMLFLATAALAGLLASFFIVTRKVVAPIQALATVITGLARQSGSVQLPHLEQKDEIGDIARSVDTFLAAAVAKERERAEAEAATQALVTSSLADGLTAMAEGDLTHTVTADFPAAYLPLKTNFNQALTALSGLVAAVGEGARSIRGGSGEIAQAADDLARRTESNAASLEETSAAVIEMERRLRAGAEAANRTVERADGAIATVSSGRTTADEAVGAMGRVAESAKGIDGVIEGLDKIAFQTRVLAMNAAVEAGRAGDAGKGFAVVADLVSALAMRAEEEAKRARDQLTVTQAEIVTAVEAVRKVDGALANISGDVGEVHQLLGSMAEDNQAQSASISQISVAIATMDQATQQNAAMVEETSAAVRNLTTEVAALADQAASFNVGETGAPARLRARAVPSAFAATPKPLPAAAVAALTRKGDEDGWTEF